MIRVQNRTPAPGQEGRVTLTPESGNPTTGVLAMADNATQPGTPWNRETGRLLQGDIRTATVAAGQSIQAGDVVDLNDDGQAVATLERLPPNFNYSADNIPTSDGVIVPIDSGEYGS